ncbi:MAG: DUF1349 domain-containing protein [Gaiellaceae bacterium]
MTDFLGWPGWRWLFETPDFQIEGDGLTWRCPGGTDYWRVTHGAPSKHLAAAFVVPVAADFRLEAIFEAHLADPYDQMGLLVESDERRWFKAGVELEDRLWLSAVHTHEESDWSRERLASLPLEIAVERRSDSVFCSVREGDAWREFRTLSLPGPVVVGAYACAPRGDGFEASMRAAKLTATDL